MIILDFGSGETCQNNIAKVASMIDQLAFVDTEENEVVIKWQLFQHIPGLTALNRSVYEFAVQYAEPLGYQTTASVFDRDSLLYLLDLKPLFIKIACRPNLYDFIPKIQEAGCQAIVSIEDLDELAHISPNYYMCCVPEYPASIEQYESKFGDKLSEGISDHTSNCYLWHAYKPKIYETHYRLEDCEGADCGPWAKTPDQLMEVL